MKIAKAMIKLDALGQGERKTGYAAVSEGRGIFNMGDRQLVDTTLLLGTTREEALRYAGQAAGGVQLYRVSIERVPYGQKKNTLDVHLL